jgi:Protein of unknown function (DUF3224)
MIERQTARGTIAVKTYEPTSYDERADAPTLVEIHVTENFSGDITGTGEVRFLQALRSDESAAFCSIERVVGSLAGRQGTFLLQDSGTLEGNQVSGSWFVIPGASSGELSGLRGEGGFEAQLGQNATWTLDYWFE